MRVPNTALAESLSDIPKLNVSHQVDVDMDVEVANSDEQVLLYREDQHALPSEDALRISAEIWLGGVLSLVRTAHPRDPTQAEGVHVFRSEYLVVDADGVLLLRRPNTSSTPSLSSRSWSLSVDWAFLDLRVHELADNASPWGTCESCTPRRSIENSNVTRVVVVAVDSMTFNGTSPSLSKAYSWLCEALRHVADVIVLVSPARGLVTTSTNMFGLDELQRYVDVDGDGGVDVDIAGPRW